MQLVSPCPIRSQSRSSSTRPSSPSRIFLWKLKPLANSPRGSPSATPMAPFGALRRSKPACQQRILQKPNSNPTPKSPSKSTPINSSACFWRALPPQHRQKKGRHYDSHHRFRLSISNRHLRCSGCVQTPIRCVLAPHLRIRGARPRRRPARANFPCPRRRARRRHRPLHLPLQPSPPPPPPPHHHSPTSPRPHHRSP